MLELDVKQPYTSGEELFDLVDTTEDENSVGSVEERRPKKKLRTATDRGFFLRAA